MRNSIVVWMLACAIAASEAWGWQDEPLCGGCETTGKVGNKLATSADSSEQDVIYCSESMRKDKVGLGADEILCLRCKGTSYHESAKSDVDGEIESRRAWLDDRKKKVDEVTGRACVHLRTKHFNLSFDLPSVKVGQVVYRTHEAAHLYAQRLEKLYSDIREIHELPESKIRAAKRFVYIVEGERAGKALGVAHTNQGNGARSSLHGDPSQMVVSYQKKDFQDDEDFHQHIAHIAAHHIYNDVDASVHWLVERYGWVQEGLAHYIEIRYHGPPNTWCHREAGNFIHWQGKNWEANVKKAVLANQAPIFEEIQAKSADALDPKEHQFAWSYIDYLMWLDPTAMPRMLGFMKGPQLPVRECLQKAYGISIPAFVAGWEEFVRTEYSLTPSKGPKVRLPKGAKEPEPEAEDSDTEDGGDR